MNAHTPYDYCGYVIAPTEHQVLAYEDFEGGDWFYEDDARDAELHIDRIRAEQAEEAECVALLAARDGESVHA